MRIECATGVAVFSSWLRRTFVLAEALAMRPHKNSYKLGTRDGFIGFGKRAYASKRTFTPAEAETKLR